MICEHRYENEHGERIECPDCMRERMQREIDRLQAIVDRLPKTADVVPIVRGMQLWCVRHADKQIVEQKCLGHDGIYVSARYPKTRSTWWWGEQMCYSTREAAEKARAT